MIIEASANETTIVSNFTAGEVIPMSISSAGQAHAMSTLSNMYNDPNLAVVREYFANGLDSHVMAGQTAPVEISLPNSYNKMYVVQDFGTGMSVDTIREVYSKYWESTKRNSNNQIGAFGLGAKSALAISNQFTVASVHDGVKATVLIQKAGDGSGIPTMNVVAVMATEEPNGVTVSVPINDIYSFNTKAREFFRFVDPSVVTIDGYPPKSVFDEVTKLDGISVPGVEAYIDMDRNYGTSYVIMGQVAYALTTENIEESSSRLGLTSTYQLRSMPVYFKIPIGDVNLTPNREGLLFDDKTNALIDTLIKEYLESVKVSAQEEVDAVEDRQEVYEVAKRWTERLGLPMQWNGKEIITEIQTATPSSTIKRTTWDKSTHGSTYTLRLNDRNGYGKVIVTGKPFDKYKRMSNYITDYLAMMDMSGVMFYFRETLDEMDNEWVTDNPKITFEDFDDMIQRVKDHRKAERAAAKALLPKGQRGDRTGKLEYPVLSLDDDTMTSTPYDEIPDGAYYVAASDLTDRNRFRELFEGRTYGFAAIINGLKRIVGEGAYVVFISKARSVESFKARMKDTEVINVKDMAEDVQQRINDLLTEDVLQARNFSLDQTANRRLQMFDQKLIDQILDEEVRNILKPVDPELKEKSDEALFLERDMHRFGFTGVQLEEPTLAKEIEELDTGARYPLANYISYHFGAEDQEHMIRYMNMVYEAQLTLVDA